MNPNHLLIITLFLSPALISQTSFASTLNCDPAVWKKEMAVDPATKILQGTLIKHCTLDFGSQNPNWSKLWNASLLSITRPGTESLAAVKELNQNYLIPAQGASPELQGVQAKVTRLNRVADENGNDPDEFKTEQVDSVAQSKDETKMVFTMRTTSIEHVGKGKALQSLEVKMSITRAPGSSILEFNIENRLGLKNPFALMPNLLFNSVAPRISRKKFEETIQVSLDKSIRNLGSQD